ncbi:RNA recognition motif domain containing protein, putative [Babesia bigemina]|uniref:RNA recognition motif domain containing protein, putative n=1 Tax=Babesia bigemina TaxID=5866 RepID=A0A061DEJ6_BABBI|nr:RNA recognition motif domain containing protein, putative [Babesia bigemina]CDR97395.1 RNA recognition motif domain containing protein, putative [Babesia bigemina]|eukprot:XP_012769581.1 RNA recognition motif domain containing protein, putative [Babesia bigemina]
MAKTPAAKKKAPKASEGKSGAKKTKKAAGKSESAVPEGVRKLRALLDQASKSAPVANAASTAEQLPPSSESSAASAPQGESAGKAKTGRRADEPGARKPKGAARPIKKKSKGGPKEYVDHPNVVFVGNVPLSVDKSELIKSLGIDPKIVKSVHFRSLPVESKFAYNKRIGVIRGKLSDAKPSQNAYVTLVDEKYVDELVAKNTMELRGHYLFINKSSPSSFSKFNRKKTVFVGRLPPNTTENELFEVFSNVSQVQGVRIIRDPVTSESKGFGFVLFDSRTAVPEAVEAFNNYSFKGYTLHVTKALDHEAASEHKAKSSKKKAPAGKKGAKHAGANKGGKPAQKRTLKAKPKNKRR